jgi:hypothetical protein
MTTAEHRNLLGKLFLVFFGIQVLVLVLTVLIIMGVLGFTFMNVAGNEAAPFIFSVIVMAVTILFVAILLIPLGVAGWRLWKKKPGARIWGIVAAIFVIFSFPLGTALGVYALWFLFSDEGRLIDSPYVGMPPPPPESWR